MTEQTHPVAAMTDDALAALLKRAVWDTLVFGFIGTVILLIASGWRNAAMMAIGAVLSAGSILEWKRLIRIFNARLDQQKTPRGSALVVGLFLLRLVLFAGAIYGSLKFLQGSAVALLCGLALAVAAMLFEALRLLRD